MPYRAARLIDTEMVDRWVPNFATVVGAPAQAITDTLTARIPAKRMPRTAILPAPSFETGSARAGYRQVTALAQGIEEALRKKGRRPLNVARRASSNGNSGFHSSDPYANTHQSEPAGLDFNVAASDTLDNLAVPGSSPAQPLIVASPKHTLDRVAGELADVV